MHLGAELALETIDALIAADGNIGSIPPKSPAVLMQNHGPFTIGKDAESAVKAAAMTEEKPSS